MGNKNSNGLGKVILPNGTIQEYTEPMTVAELMLDHPQQAVVEFDQTLTNGKRPKPLPADAKIETKKVYIMVPKRSGRPIGEISLEEARRILLRVNNNVALNTRTFGSAYTGFLPLFARMCPASGVVKIKKKKVKNNEEKLSQIVVVKNEGLFREVDLESEVMESYFLSRQLSGKNAWKPSLDTIKEKGVKAKIRHWLI